MSYRAEDANALRDRITELEAEIARLRPVAEKSDDLERSLNRAKERVGELKAAAELAEKSAEGKRVTKTQRRGPGVLLVGTVCLIIGLVLGYLGSRPVRARGVQLQPNGEWTPAP